MNNKMTVKMLVEGGVMLALAYVLSLIVVFQMPSGGSITAVSMLPILIFAVRYGTGPGLFVAIVYGAIQFILGPKWSFHPVSILLDYVVGFGFLGLAGLFGNTFSKATAGILFSIFMRFTASVISGVVVFASYAPAGQNPMVYSMIYNASYLIPEAVLTLVVFSLLYKRLVAPRVVAQVRAEAQG
jgi:thiamine transporter